MAGPIHKYILYSKEEVIMANFVCKQGVQVQ
jgi:hypothetical protein